MSIASFFCPKCGAGYHVHEGHECKSVWRVIAPDGREWRNPRLMAAVSAAIEETKLQFPADASGVKASDDQSQNREETPQ
jgi:hypothetical protein